MLLRITVSSCCPWHVCSLRITIRKIKAQMQMFSDHCSLLLGKGAHLQLVGYGRKVWEPATQTWSPTCYSAGATMRVVGGVLTQQPQSPEGNGHGCRGQLWWHTPETPALGWWEQEDQKFKFILSNLASLRSAWVLWGPALKKKKNPW